MENESTYSVIMSEPPCVTLKRILDPTFWHQVDSPRSGNPWEDYLICCEDRKSCWYGKHPDTLAEIRLYKFETKPFFICDVCYDNGNFPTSATSNPDLMEIFELYDVLSDYIGSNYCSQKDGKCQNDKCLAYEDHRLYVHRTGSPIWCRACTEAEWVSLHGWLRNLSQLEQEIA